LVLGKKVDLVFIHMCPRYAILAAPFAKLMRVPTVMWFTHRSVNNELRIAHWLVDKVVTASRESFRLKSYKVVITGHGIDTDRFKPLDVRSEGNTKVILSVGRISPIKDYETLITAADILIKGRNFGNLKFLIIGGVGTEAQKGYLGMLHRMVADHGLGEYIEFAGPVPHRDIVAYYQNCDLFVNLSHTGSLDKAMLEAMACGNAPITSNEAFTSVLDDYADRLMFDEGSVDGLVEKSLAILRVSNEARVALGQELRDIVLKGHNLERLMESLLRIFKECVRRSPNSPLY